MNLPPLATQGLFVLIQYLADTPDLMAGKTMIFPQLCITTRAPKHEHGLSLRADDVHMGRPVVRRINHNS
ncbi:hypothetical protein M911_11980 [Ectothiorhodospira haloalkaliphila]|uniref:Uncharacterized protein n=1 Tax=Ectothiorhodospira haloalkaliphila TaxID=421628 RepID=W8KLS8_9GAMM|nr:hypothetical protein M911_11980 [Ectothiorhodospira haloalkaliphila]